jgi:hypothetical protein
MAATFIVAVRGLPGGRVEPAEAAAETSPSAGQLPPA